MNLITLAAGMGTRLIKRSQIPKPFQIVKGKSIIEWSLTSYQYFINKRIINVKNLYFVILKEHIKKFDAINRLKKIFGDSIKIIVIPKLTSGPADTARIALKKINNNNPIIINDSDHYFNGNALFNEIIKIKKTKEVYGIINTTNTNSKKPNWSYINENDKGKLIGVKEKDIKLAQSNARGIIGSYFFSNKKIFLNEANKIIKTSNNKEFFISEVINNLIKKNKKFNVCFTKKIYPLGNYEQVKKFEKKFDFKDFYPEPKTIIIDFDGVLIRHDDAGGSNSKQKKFIYPTKAISSNVDLIKNEYKNGSFIVVMSARPENERRNVMKELSKFKINYHKILLGVASGSRVVINDKKKSHPNIKTAIAIETRRNSIIKKI
jgi:dTDP-glucose pyrophosphorylase